MGNSCASLCLANGAVLVDPSGHHSGGRQNQHNPQQESQQLRNSSGNAEEQRPLQHHCPDPLVYDLVRRNNPNYPSMSIGQHHLLYKKGKPPVDLLFDPATTGKNTQQKSTRLVVRKHESSQTQIYAIRSTEPHSEQRPPDEELSPPRRHKPKQSQQSQQQRSKVTMVTPKSQSEPDLAIDPYTPQHMAVPPIQRVNDWVCVSEELNIYICDTGLTHTECDALVQTTEQVCKGHYAAYTYAKQTLGCREYPVLAHACWDAVHRVTHSIWTALPASQKLQLDDREPHIVKYDVTKKERQKLDMHTDKSEWTFLIALSDGCGLDYEGGGTFFEALNATVHVQRGHALIFPGKLRHCGQRITKGLRFLLVGFLVDKTNTAKTLLQATVATANAVEPTIEA